MDFCHIFVFQHETGTFQTLQHLPQKLLARTSLIEGFELSLQNIVYFAENYLFNARCDTFNDDECWGITPTALFLLPSQLIPFLNIEPTCRALQLQED